MDGRTVTQTDRGIKHDTELTSLLKRMGVSLAQEACPEQTPKQEMFWIPGIAVIRIRGKLMLR